MKPARHAPKVVVIGAGLGGLATALRLTRAGYAVSILEKNSDPGGKIGWLQHGGYRFDTGPSLLTMPFILEDLFKSIGESLTDHITIERVDPICRYHYPDGQILNAWNDEVRWEKEIRVHFPGDSGSHARFMRHGEMIYEAAAEPFLFSPMRLRDMIRPMSIAKHLPSMFRLDAFRTLHSAVENFFHAHQLRILYDRFATYNGSSPYRAPATLSIIPYIEFHFGGWYIRGGMYNLIRALHALAEKYGVEIHVGTEAQRILCRDDLATGVVTGSGETVDADIVICNADVLYARSSLLQGFSHKENGRKVDLSSSGYVLFLGIDRTYESLAHHTIFFSHDYREEFQKIFSEQRPADEPTIYVCNTSHSDPTHAPRGHSNLFVLVNTPPVPDKEDDPNPDIGPRFYETRYRDRILSLLEQKGLERVREHIRFERAYTPFDLEMRFHAFRGSIYGSSSNSRLAAFRRPRNRDRRIRNLFFAGGGSHPGGGIPLVLLSAAITSKLVREAYPTVNTGIRA